MPAMKLSCLARWCASRHDHLSLQCVTLLTDHEYTDNDASHFARVQERDTVQEAAALLKKLGYRGDLATK